MRNPASPARIGRWSAHHPWRAIALWLVFVACCLAAGAVTGTEELSNGSVGESARGYELMDRHDLWPDGHELAYIHSDSLEAGAPGVLGGDPRRAQPALGARLHASSTRISRDRHSAVVVADLDRYVPFERIQAAISATQRAHPQVSVEETGDIAASRARDRIIDDDLERVELLAIPVTLLVLLLAFGSLVAALVPVLLGLTAVAAGVGLLGPLSQIFPVEDSAKTVILLIGLAVGVDYALFYVVRSREERRRGASLGGGARAHLTHVGPDGDRVGHDGRDRDGRHVPRRRQGPERDRRGHHRRHRLRRRRLGHRSAGGAARPRAEDRPRPRSRSCRRSSPSGDSRFWPALVERVLRRPVARRRRLRRDPARAGRARALAAPRQAERPLAHRARRPGAAGAGGRPARRSRGRASRRSSCVTAPPSSRAAARAGHRAAPAARASPAASRIHRSEITANADRTAAVAQPAAARRRRERGQPRTPSRRCGGSSCPRRSAVCRASRPR